MGVSVKIEPRPESPIQLWGLVSNDCEPHRYGILLHFGQTPGGDDFAAVAYVTGWIDQKTKVYVASLPTKLSDKQSNCDKRPPKGQVLQAPRVAPRGVVVIRVTEDHQ